MMSSSQAVGLTLGEDTIADTAERARQLLLCCQEITDEEPRKLASTQLARFNLWASNIGVFAARHASLDYRLRTALAVRATIEGNLDIVCKHLLTTLKASPELSEEEFNALFDAPRTHVSVFAKGLLLKATSDDHARTKELELVESRITILHQLSLAIRQASNRNTLTKIPKLLEFDTGYDIIRDWTEDGAEIETSVNDVRFDIGAEFEEFVRRTLTYRWLRLRSSNEEDLNEEQKSYRETLLGRCVATVSIRRRQLEYFRAHQTRVEQSSKDKFVSWPRQPLDAKLTQQDDFQRREQPKGKDLLLGVSENLGFSRQSTFSYEPSHATHEETVVSEFVVSNFKPLPASTVPSSSVSTTPDGGFGSGSPFDVPPPPKLDGNEKERICPYCYLVLPAKTFSTVKRWERHLVEDLQPYVCLFANCSLPGKTYSSFKAWRTHLSQPHYRTWHCPLHPKDASSDAADDDDEALTFDTLLKFKSHLKIFHSDLDASSAEDAFRHGHQLAALPQWCFVCFEALPQSTALLQHMNNHFKSMSLLALPWRNDITDEEAMASDEASSSASTNDNPDSFEGWEETDETVAEPAKKLETEEFASLLSAVGETSSIHQHRLRSLETWTQGRWKETQSLGELDTRVTHLCNEATKLAEHFERTDDMRDLDTAITILEQAEETLPEGDIRRAGVLDRLGVMFSTRYKKTKLRHDLNRAIGALSTSVNATPIDDPHGARLLNNLETMLFKRYSLTQSLEDLEAAIASANQAISALPKSNAHRARLLSDLGTMLLKRYEKMRSLDDLEAAVTNANQALYAIPEDHPDWEMLVIDLMKILFSRFEETRRLDDGEAAIRNANQAISAATETRRHRDRWQHQFEIQLSRIYPRKVSWRDVEAVITNAKQVASVTPHHDFLVQRALERTIQAAKEEAEKTAVTKAADREAPEGSVEADDTAAWEATASIEAERMELGKFPGEKVWRDEEWERFDILSDILSKKLRRRPIKVDYLPKMQ